MFNPQNPEILDLNRQRKMAELLLAQGAESPQGQTVSGGIYVPPSPLKYLANLYSTYVGTEKSKTLDSQEQELAKRLRDQEANNLQKGFDQLYGTPAQAGGILGPNGQMTQETTADMYGPNMELNAPYRQVAEKAAIQPNRRLALATLLAPEGGATSKAIAARIAEQEFAPPKQTVVSPGASLVGPDGRLIYQAPFKPKGGAGGEGDGDGVMGSNVNNNGVSIGKFDKMGRYRAPNGTVYSAKAVDEARAEHDTATDLAYKLNQLSGSDIKNAYGSLTDYTTSKVGRMAAPTRTLDAQTKVNNIGINNTLTNLSRLKGASSDKEMAQMIKDFPGYEAPPEVMQNWVERAAKTTNRFLKRSEGRFGFDTDYAEEGRFSAKAPSTTSGASNKNSKPPAGVTQAEWNAMSDADKKLFE